MHISIVCPSFFYSSNYLAKTGRLASQKYGRVLKLQKLTADERGLVIIMQNIHLAYQHR